MTDKRISENKINEQMRKQIEKLKDFNRFYLLQNNPEGKSFVDRLIDKSNSLHLDIQKDAKILMNFLSHPVSLKRTGTEKITTKEGKAITVFRAKEEVIFADTKKQTEKYEFLSKSFPDVIFIPGNNDLFQIDELVKTLVGFKKYLIDHEGLSVEQAEEKISGIPIVISGKGGHGVAPGPIYVSTEAAAMGHYLESFLQYKHNKKNPIILEENATNSGQNVDFTKIFIREIEERAEKKFKESFPDKDFPGIRMWLVPTPVGGIRQIATVSQQASVDTKSGGAGYKLNQVYMLPPNEKTIINNYFGSMSEEDVGINMFAALRETVNFLGYMLDNDFMSPHAPDEKRLTAALSTVTQYSEILTGKKLSDKNRADLIDDMVHFSKLKEAAGGIELLPEDAKKLRIKIKERFDPIKTYFQKTFNQIERQHMPFLPDQIEFKEDVKDEKYILSKQERFIKKSIFATHHLIVEPFDVPVDRKSQHRNFKK